MSCDVWREEADWSCSNGDFALTERRDWVTELLTEFNPPDQDFAELLACFFWCSTGGRCAGALGVLGPPSDEGAVVITDLFDSGTGERSVEPTLQRQLRRSLRHGSKCNSALPIARYNTSMTADAKSSVPAVPP